MVDNHHCRLSVNNLLAINFGTALKTGRDKMCRTSVKERQLDCIVNGVGMGHGTTGQPIYRFVSPLNRAGAGAQRVMKPGQGGSVPKAGVRWEEEKPDTAPAVSTRKRIAAQAAG